MKHIEILSKSKHSKKENNYIELEKVEEQIYNLLQEKVYTSREIADNLFLEIDNIKNYLQRMRYHGIIELVELFSSLNNKKKKFWKIEQQKYSEIQGDTHIIDFENYFDNAFHKFKKYEEE